jgi:hypothetical protein
MPAFWPHNNPDIFVRKIKMKSISFLLFALCTTMHVYSQDRRPVEENTPIIIDGVELGYIITEEDTRSAGKEEFARFKVTFYANNGGCARAYRLRETSSSESNNLVASFFVRNANGKRMTSRDAKLYAREWYVPVRINDKDEEGKTVSKIREMMAGHIFRLGDNLEASIIVLVPNGERPLVDVILNRSSDL